MLLYVKRVKHGWMLVEKHLSWFRDQFKPLKYFDCYKNCLTQDIIKIKKLEKLGESHIYKNNKDMVREQKWKNKKELVIGGYK